MMAPVQEGDRMTKKLLAVETAVKFAQSVEYPELEEVLKSSGLSFLHISADEQGNIALDEPTGVVVAWFLPRDSWEGSLDVEGGEKDHHVTLVYLGEVADLTLEQEHALVATVAEVATRHYGGEVIIEGDGVFENEDATVWWAKPHSPVLGELHDDLVASLAKVGLSPKGKGVDDYVPHVTLAYLPAGEPKPYVTVGRLATYMGRITVAVGGRRFDFPLQDRPYNEVGSKMPTEYILPSVRTPFIPQVPGTVQKAAGGQREWRYTLGPVYMPGMVDAHGDSIDADELEEAIHEYVRTGNRDIRLQHMTDVVAGEWVGLLVWPWPVTVPVMDDGVLVQRTFPAGTPFMGVVWNQDVWEKLIVPGHVRGYSLGGFAQFEVTAELDGDEDAIARYSPSQPRDDHGRWTSGMGGSITSGGGGKPEVNAETGYRKTAHAEADRIYQLAQKHEAEITATVQELAKSHGAEMRGLKYRFKEPKSMARKINNEAQARGVSDLEAAKGIGDGLRYTMIANGDGHTSAAKDTLDALEAKGYKLRVKNYWQTGDPYQGINAVITSPGDGFQWELQFHTDESFKVKDSDNHKLYEVYRESTNDGERLSLWNKMVSNAATIAIPAAVLSIPVLKLQTFQTAAEAGLV
jgi:hypothetical protein